MNSIQEWIRRLATPLVVLLLLIAGPPAAWCEESVTIEGEIEVAAYDEQGDTPIAVFVWDSEWYSVLISNEGQGKGLMDHIGAVASVTGTITELEDNQDFDYVMKVSSYVIEEPAGLEDFPEDEPDSYPEEER